MAKSVIILDEAQALPIQLLNTILDGLKILVRDYGVTIVISTATQPAFTRRVGFEQGIADVREIVPTAVRAFERLKRVEVQWPGDAPAVEWSSLAAELSQHDDVLAIVHRRADARELTLCTDALVKSGVVVHLSALMCPAHRSLVLEQLRATRRRGEPIRLISTQLIEAGVDVDFPVVYRALAGLDAIAQAAGRCNREGRLKSGTVRVFRAPTSPPPGVPRAALAVTQSLLRRGPLSIDDPGAFQKFFNALYPAHDLDRHQLQDARARFDFRNVARLFQMVEDNWSAPVIVPWGEAQECIRELEIVGAHRSIWRRLQRFTVNVPVVARNRWIAQGLAREIEGAVAIVPGAVPYDDRFGLRLDQEGVHSPESLVIDE